MAGEGFRGSPAADLPDLGLHEYRVTHPVAVDLPVAGQPLPATMAAYDMQGTPTTILLDRDGRIRLQALGGVDDLQLGLQLGRLLGR